MKTTDLSVKIYADGAELSGIVLNAIQYEVKKLI